MQSKLFTPRFFFISLMIILAAFSRIIPHPFNFTSLSAICIFGSAYFTKKWQAFVIPFAATFLSDLFINNVIYHQYYPTFTWFYEGIFSLYASYLLIAMVSLLIFNRKVNTTRIVGASLSATVIFFLVSNFGCFVNAPEYPQNFSGLMACYAAGIPFIKNSLLGDLFYSGVLFGAYYFATRKLPSLVKA